MADGTNNHEMGSDLAAPGPFAGNREELVNEGVLPKSAVEKLNFPDLVGMQGEEQPIKKRVGVVGAGEVGIPQQKRTQERERVVVDEVPEASRNKFWELVKELADQRGVPMMEENRIHYTFTFFKTMKPNFNPSSEGEWHRAVENFLDSEEQYNKDPLGYNTIEVEENPKEPQTKDTSNGLQAIWRKITGGSREK